jgi:SAM-dependent methyltransferase
LPYRREEGYWLGFFGRMADRITQDFAPRTVLDAGCAMGFLVEALRDRGVEAFGFDISGYALSRVRPDIAPFTWPASIVDPLDRDYDLIVCIEVLEHLPAREIDDALDNLCGHAREVLFSSTPEDFREPSHFSVRPTSHWVGAFARRGLIPDVRYDASFVTPWARRFVRGQEPMWRTLEEYERIVARLQRETQELREELLMRRGREAEAPKQASRARRSVLRALRRRVARHERHAPS